MSNRPHASNLPTSRDAWDLARALTRVRSGHFFA